MSNSIVETTAQIMIKFFDSKEAAYLKQLQQLDNIPEPRRCHTFSFRREKLLDSIAWAQSQRKKLQDGDYSELESIQKRSLIQ